MKSMMIAALLMVGSFAHADGFKCYVEDYGLNVKIMDHTSPALGTRNVAVMILSDENVQFGNKTIARFDAQSGTVSSSETSYTAKVDLRFSDISRKGENVLGTKLGQLDTIKATVNFWYNRPVRAGQEVSGTLSWVKRNGQTGRASMVCERYLKN